VKYEYTCQTTRAAWRLFDKHHRFVLLEMLNPESDFGMWKMTSVYQYYKENFKVSGAVPKKRNFHAGL
jgi:hypothetical protein